MPLVIVITVTVCKNHRVNPCYFTTLRLRIRALHTYHRLGFIKYDVLPSYLAKTSHLIAEIWAEDLRCAITRSYIHSFPFSVLMHLTSSPYIYYITLATSYQSGLRANPLELLLTWWAGEYIYDLSSLGTVLKIKMKGRDRYTACGWPITACAFAQLCCEMADSQITSFLQTDLFIYFY